MELQDIFEHVEDIDLMLSQGVKVRTALCYLTVTPIFIDGHMWLSVEAAPDVRF